MNKMTLHSPLYHFEVSSWSREQRTPIQSSKPEVKEHSNGMQKTTVRPQPDQTRLLGKLFFFLNGRKK